MATRRSLSVSVSPPNSQTRWWGGSSAAKTILTAGSLYSNRLTPSGAAAVPPATAAFCLAPPEPPQATPKTRTKVARARERLAPRIGAGGDEEGLAGRSGGAHAASSVSRPGGQARPWRHRPVPLKSSASCRSSVKVSIVGRRTSGKQVYSCGHRAAANERVAPGEMTGSRGIPPIGSATPALLAQARDRYPTSSESPSSLSDAKYRPPVGGVQCCSKDEATFEMESKAKRRGVCPLEGMMGSSFSGLRRRCRSGA